MENFALLNSESLLRAKVATRLEFEESRALELDIMISKGDRLLEVGPEGKETVVGEIEYKPIPVTERDFTIGG